MKISLQPNNFNGNETNLNGITAMKDEHDRKTQRIR